ncbi:MAG: SUMF1/EgtB/PvdO family nonheme iron enzyme [Deltaproteobacteria bacterium]|nr:SUMF1/EgtB/PvdO family nonheme iron enzyme [Deltaproteobacteria bacterium]
MRRWRATGWVVASAAAFLAAANVASCGLDAVGGAPSPEAAPEDTFRPEANLPDSFVPVDGDTDGGPDAGPACPTGRGPAMVRVALPDAAPFCIDSTEVTNAQYDEFFYGGTDGGRVAEGGVGAGTSCSTVLAFTRRADAAAPNLPVENVSWCDAFAYCRWAGRRLCQPLADGGVETEWTLACSNGGERTYPYGDAYAPVCNDSFREAGPVTVGSQPGCEGGVPGLFDMSGNVGEYVGHCANPALCDYVGGYYSSTSIEVSCTSRAQQQPGAATPGLGFRCCATPN